jgi:LuxR family transcriptional regulator of csgAB operon
VRKTRSAGQNKKADGSDSGTPKTACYIVGPMRLQNELMASFLKSKTGNRCTAVDDIGQIPKEARQDGGPPRLFFIDCQGRNLKVLLARLLPFIKKNGDGSRVVLFNVPADADFQKQYILKGIHGFFYTRDPLENFTKGVQAVINGQLWLSREMMTQCIFEGTGQDEASQNAGDILTERQIEILAMIAVGSTNDEIAAKLCISPHTVKTHLYRIFKKIEVPNRVQAALWAAKNL